MPLSAVMANELEVATSLLFSIAIDKKVNVCDADHTEDVERVVEYLQSLELKYRGLLTEISKAQDAFNRLLKAQANKDGKGIQNSVKELAAILDNIIKTTSAASNNNNSSTASEKRCRGQPKGSSRKKVYSQHSGGRRKKEGMQGTSDYKRKTDTDIAARGTGKRTRLSNVGSCGGNGADPMD